MSYLYNLKKDDKVIIFTGYGKNFEFSNVVGGSDWNIELENGMTFSKYSNHSKGVSVIPFDEDQYNEAQRIYRIRKVIYGLHFSKKMHHLIDDETLKKLEALFNEEDFNHTISLAYSVGGLQKEASFLFDFLKNNED